MTRSALVALLLGVPALGAAQGNTAELLDQAVQYHADLDVERELVILRRIVSPNSPFVVTYEQRVVAYKYLGAALAVEGHPDSAVLYFRAAIERDPFTDLEPQKFTPKELAAFAEARRLTFALAARLGTADTIDPRTERIGFTVLSTHAAALRVELRPAGASSGITLYDGENDGLRELRWDGLLEGGRLAAPGRYELLVRGQSRVSQRADSARLYFSLAHQHPPLEDTLPPLRADELLAERLPSSAARGELFKGFGIAAAMLLVPRLLASGDLQGGGRTLAAGAAGGAAAAGVVSFVFRKRHLEVPANVAANARRRAERAAANAAIVQRNQQRLAQTRLVVAPAAGVGP